MIKQILFFILLFSSCFISLAKIYSPVFKNFSIDDGLSHSYVRCIENDRYGFMWFGTYDGLNRFDGTNFKVFRHNPSDSSSICGNSISALYCDRANVLWVGTRNGLCTTEAGSNQFLKPRRYVSSTKGYKPIDEDVTTILQNKDNGQLYIGTYASGMLRYDSKEVVFKTILLRIPNGNLTENYSVLTATFDAQNRLYLGVSEYGLCVLDDDGTIKVLNSSILNFFCMHFNRSLFVGNENGLFVYNLERNSFEESDIQGTQNTGIHHLFTDAKGILWIATETNGVVLYEPRTNEIKTISGGYNHEQLSSPSIYCIFQDSIRGFWIGTMREGLTIGIL